MASFGDALRAAAGSWMGLVASSKKKKNDEAKRSGGAMATNASTGGANKNADPSSAQRSLAGAATTPGSHAAPSIGDDDGSILDALFAPARSVASSSASGASTTTSKWQRRPVSTRDGSSKGDGASGRSYGRSGSKSSAAGDDDARGIATTPGDAASSRASSRSASSKHGRRSGSRKSSDNGTVARMISTNIIAHDLDDREEDDVSISSGRSQSSQSSAGNSSIKRAREIIRENTCPELDTPSANAYGWSSAVRRMSRRRKSKSIWDLESGGMGNGSNVLGEKQTVRRRRRRCALVLTAIALAACTLAALVGLNVIPMVPHFGGSSPPRLGIGRGHDPRDEVDDEDTARAVPTLVPTEDGTVSSMAWYADWDAHRCVQDCDEREGSQSLSCGGRRREGWEESYDSAWACCKFAFESYLDEHWTVDECMAVSGGGGRARVDDSGPTAWPTPAGTERSTGGNGGMRPLRRRTVRPTRRPTRYQGQRPIAQQPSAYSVSSSSRASTELYYPDWDAKRCSLEESSGKKPWDTGYETDGECCRINFGWDETSVCYAGTAATTADVGFDRGTSKASSEEDESSSIEEEEPAAATPQLLYYAVWELNRCALENSSVKKPWDVGYQSDEECCCINYNYSRNRH